MKSSIRTHTHAHTGKKMMKKKCGKTVAYFISIITVHREFIVEDLSEMCHNEEYFGTVNRSKPTKRKKRNEIARKIQRFSLGTHTWQLDSHSHSHAIWNGKKL